MTANTADYTNTFRDLINGAAREHFQDTAGFDQWAKAWQKRLGSEADPETVMRQSNPAFIPRNHRIEEIITSAVTGDFAPFEQLHAVLKRPYDDQPEAQHLTRPPEPDEIVQATFCGT